MSTKQTPSVRRRSSGERGDGTREKLLLAAIDVFGRYGFDGTTTRALALAAGVNLQAIPYYFGGKQGLYIAAAEHIGSQIAGHTADVRERTRTRFADIENRGDAMGKDEARALLSEILQRMAALFLGNESETWARFIIREQMEPTEAFQRVYGQVMGPMLGLVGRLVATLLDEDPRSEHVRLRTVALAGGVLVFRVAHAAALAHLEWKAVGPREIDVVRALAADLAASVGQSPENR